MSKRTIIILIAIVLVISAAVLCFVPRITRFDQVMTAVKVDADGNELGTASFRVQATKYDFLFWDSRFSCWIPDFDTLSSFERKDQEPLQASDHCFVSVSAVSNDTKDIVFCDLYSSPELDRWLLWNRAENVFYIASGNSDYLTADLLGYFSEIIGDSQIPTDQSENGTIELNWTMNGSLVNADGGFAGSVPLTIQGTIQDNYPESDTAQLDITLPDHFHNSFPGSESDYVSINRIHDGLSYYVFHSYGYDSYANTPIMGSFALDPSKGYVIMHWDDDSGQFLVASRSSDATAANILEHFQGFIDQYSFKNK